VKIKSIMSIVLCLSICLFCMPSVLADATQGNYDENIVFLKAMGIIDTQTYDSNEMITKSEAVYTIMKMIGQNSESFGYNGELKGLPEGHPYAGMLKAAIELGLVDLDSNYLFNPNSTVSYADAARMVFAALGYNRAVNTASSDAWYLKLAADNRLNGNVKITNNGKLTKGEWGGILYNAAHIPLMKRVSFGPIAEYQVEKNITALSEYLQIFKKEGIVSANSITSLRARAGVGENTIEIDGFRIKTKDVVLNEEALLGKDVKAYYKLSDNDDAYLIYVKESGKTEYLRILSDEFIADFTNYTYMYSSSLAGSGKAVVDGTAAIIYNGIAVTDEDFKILNESLFIPKNGEVELLRSGKSGKFDIVKIKSYATYIVHNVSKTENLIFDKYGKDALSIDPYIRSNVRIVDKNGNRFTIADLEEWDVLSVAISNDGNYVEIIVSADAVKGLVTGRSQDTLTLEMEEFKLSQDLVEELAEYLKEGSETKKTRIPEVGSQIVAYLDQYGKIAAMQVQTTDEWKFGYLIKMQPEKPPAKNLEFKILTQDDKIEYFKSAYPIVVDAAVYKSASAAQSAIEAEHIIRYQLNDEGQIRRIDTHIQGEKEDSFSLMRRASGSLKFKSNVTTFGGLIFPKTSAVIFAVPSSANGPERDYKVTTITTFVNDASYNVVAYSVGDDSLKEDAILYKKASLLPQNAREIVTIITQISNAVDDDGIPIQKIYGMNAGGNRIYTIYSDDPNTSALVAEKNIKPGDLARITADNNMIVSRIERVFDGTSKTISSEMGGINPNTGYDAIIRISYGKVINRAEGLIQVELHNEKKTIEKYKEAGLVFVCEENKRVRKGSFDDIIPGVSSIVVNMYYSQIRTITIYN